MSVIRAAGIASFAALALAACGGGGGSSGGGMSSPTPPPVITRSYTFPAGDASASAGATAWDIIGVTTTLSGQFAGSDSYDTLRVDVSFAQNISGALPNAGQQLSNAGNELGVSIALDTDGNPNTGNGYACVVNSKTPFEYGSDQGNNPSRLGDGNYSILMNGAPIASGGQNAPAEAMTAVSGATFSQTFFLTAINVHAGGSIPHIGIAVIAVNGTGMNASGIGNTDCVPKQPALEVFTS